MTNNGYVTAELGQAYFTLDEGTAFLKNILDVLNDKGKELISAAEKQNKLDSEIASAFGKEISAMMPARHNVHEDLKILNQRSRFVTAIGNYIKFLMREIDNAEWVADSKFTPNPNTLRISISTKRHGLFWIVFNCEGVYFTNKNLYAKAIQDCDPDLRIVKFDVESVETLPVYPIMYKDDFAFAFAKYIQTKFCQLNDRSDGREVPW